MVFCPGTLANCNTVLRLRYVGLGLTETMELSGICGGIPSDEWSGISGRIHSGKEE